MTASGFYTCGFAGDELKFWKFGASASFTLCKVDIYKEINLMNLKPTITTNIQGTETNGWLLVGNLQRTHPVGYSKYTTEGEIFSTG